MLEVERYHELEEKMQLSEEQYEEDARDRDIAHRKQV